MLRPGTCEALATEPLPTGSPTPAKTIGMVVVACFAAACGRAGARRDEHVDLSA